MPSALAVMLCEVAPFDQAKLLPADAVSSTDPPAQKLSGPEAVMLAACGVNTLISAEALLLQPLASVTVTL